MNRRLLVSLVVVLIVSNVLLGLRMQSLSAASDEKDKDSAYRNIELFTQVMEIVRKDYVDGEKLSYQDLTYSALKGMLNSLDPHSQFMEPSAYEEMKQETGGSFGGIGVVIGLKDGVITVISPMEDTPGFKAGLLPGDKIIRIEGKSTERMNLQDAVKQLRGTAGTKVAITILRSKNREIKDLVITRAVIKVESVKDGKIISDKIGYVRIVQFNEPTADEFEKNLQKLEKEGMEGLVIDLRNNPGGLLESAVDVVGKFLAKGELVVYTEGRDAALKTMYRVRSGRQHPKYPLAVLINEGSASGSEIVAGALQDAKRAVVVGETSFGKGSVQSVIPVRNNCAIRLTTAKYYTPSKKVIHEHGITPDIIVPMSEEDWNQVMLQRSQALIDAASEKGGGKQPKDGGAEKGGKGGKNEKSEPMDKTGKTDKTEKKGRENHENRSLVRDVQLDRAVDLLKGINVYMERKGGR
ncbi:MAG: S41 family peptidase [Verrucomicrobiae bacterium]|nr:S41 family peptidase [Verrucomicrobiae bacterium]